MKHLRIWIAAATLSAALMGCQAPSTGQSQESSGAVVGGGQGQNSSNDKFVCDGVIGGLKANAVVEVQQMLHHKLVTIIITTPNSQYNCNIEYAEGQTSAVTKLNDSNNPNMPMDATVEFIQNGFILTTNTNDPNGMAQYQFTRH